MQFFDIIRIMKKAKLDIIYEDKHLIVVNKKAGVLTVATEKEREKTLFHEVIEYEKKKNKNNKIFVVHRLDKDTSGLVVFAKSIKVKNILQSSWEKVKRKYVAVVQGQMEKTKETLVSYLKEAKNFNVYEVQSPSLGQKAITTYQVIYEGNNYAILDIEIKTGRKHQIRVQLANINHPILGDKKYGKAKTNYRNMLLHAYFLAFSHPVTGKMLCLESSFPKVIKDLNKKESSI